MHCLLPPEGNWRFLDHEGKNESTKQNECKYIDFKVWIANTIWLVLNMSNDQTKYYVSFLFY